VGRQFSNGGVAPNVNHRWTLTSEALEERTALIGNIHIHISIQSCTQRVADKVRAKVMRNWSIICHSNNVKSVKCDAHFPIFPHFPFSHFPLRVQFAEHFLFVGFSWHRGVGKPPYRPIFSTLSIFPTKARQDRQNSP